MAATVQYLCLIYKKALCYKSITISYFFIQHFAFKNTEINFNEVQFAYNKIHQFKTAVCSWDCYPSAVPTVPREDT